MKKADRSLKRLSTVALLAMGLGLGLTACKSGSERSMAQQWGDRQVAKGVKKELAKDPKYKYGDVRPVVYEGTVQLTGFVDTLEQRQRAAELAAQAKGVRQVINNIALKPTPTGREEFNTNTLSAPTAPAQGNASPAQRSP